MLSGVFTKKWSIDDDLNLIQKSFIENKTGFISILTKLCTRPHASTYHSQLVAVIDSGDQGIAATINSIFNNKLPQDHSFVLMLTVLVNLFPERDFLQYLDPTVRLRIESYINLLPILVDKARIERLTLSPKNDLANLAKLIKSGSPQQAEPKDDCILVQKTEQKNSEPELQLADIFEILKGKNYYDLDKTVDHFTKQLEQISSEKIKDFVMDPLLKLISVHAKDNYTKSRLISLFCKLAPVMAARCKDLIEDLKNELLKTTHESFAHQAGVIALTDPLLKLTQEQILEQVVPSHAAMDSYHPYQYNYADRIGDFTPLILQLSKQAIDSYLIPNLKSPLGDKLPDSYSYSGSHRLSAFCKLAPVMARMFKERSVTTIDYYFKIVNHKGYLYEAQGNAVEALIKTAIIMAEEPDAPFEDLARKIIALLRINNVSITHTLMTRLSVELRLIPKQFIQRTVAGFAKPLLDYSDESLDRDILYFLKDIAALSSYLADELVMEIVNTIFKMKAKNKPGTVFDALCHYLPSIEKINFSDLELSKIAINTLELYKEALCIDDVMSNGPAVSEDLQERVFMSRLAKLFHTKDFNLVLALLMRFPIDKHGSMLTDALMEKTNNYVICFLINNLIPVIEKMSTSEHMKLISRLNINMQIVCKSYNPQEPSASTNESIIHLFSAIYELGMIIAKKYGTQGLVLRLLNPVMDSSSSLAQENSDRVYLFLVQMMLKIQDELAKSQALRSDINKSLTLTANTIDKDEESEEKCEKFSPSVEATDSTSNAGVILSHQIFFASPVIVPVTAVTPKEDGVTCCSLFSCCRIS